MRRNSLVARIVATSFATFLAAYFTLSSVAFAVDAREGVKDDRPFSIEVRDAELTDVLRALAQQSGLNLIIGEGVSGKTSLSFKDIPFKDALEMIIKANNLTYTIQNNVFWVGAKVDTSDEITAEIILLNHAEPATVVERLKGTLSADGAAFPDTRTNSVLVRDLPRNLPRIRSLIKVIDRQTAQVVIEARIVEASNNFTRQLGFHWGGSYVSGSNVAGGSSMLPMTGDAPNFAVSLPTSATAAGVNLVLNSLASNLSLDLQLLAAQSRGELRIISRPRIATLNNKAATIHSGLTFRVKLNQFPTTTGGVATNTTTGIQEIKTGIDLTVTPRISSDGMILLGISTTKSDPDFGHIVDGIPGVTEKSASTSVLVRDGETIVIGGLYKNITSDQTDAVPFLENIPLLGNMFKSNTRTQLDEELLVFITPTIMNNDNPNTEVRN
ncbi:MAG: type IV pilus secretin PilQ [Deltaproteobacteria bacterium]